MAVDMLQYLITAIGPSFPVTITIMGTIFVTAWMYFTSLHYLMSRTETLPLLRFKTSTLARYIMKKCSLLRTAYRPGLFLTSGHIQTILSYLVPIPERDCYQRTYFQARDRGVVALDWFVDETLEKPSPVLVVIPNVSADAASVTGLCRQASQRGFRCVVFNRRGQGNSFLTTPCIQVIGDHTDLRQVVNYLKAEYPSSSIAAVSYGLGSGLLMSYLGEYGSSSRIDAVGCISPAFDYKNLYRRGLPQPYRWRILQALRSVVYRNAKSFRENVVMEALQTDDLLQLDYLVSGRGDGCKTVDEYWEAVNPLRDVDDICCPLLAVSAADDPICDATNIQYDLFSMSPNFFLCLTEYGGHCGFRQRRLQKQQQQHQHLQPQVRFQEKQVKNVRDVKNVKVCSWAEELCVDYLGAILRFLKLEERGCGVRFKSL